MQNNPQDRFVAREMKRLYGMKEEGLDEFKIGSHKSGGCEICYDGGIKAIKHYKGGVKVYKKENPNDAIHIDVGSHNIIGGAKHKKYDYDEKSSSDSECERVIGGSEHDRVIGGRRRVDRVNLPSSSMAGGAKKKPSDKLKKRADKVKEIMKKMNLSMIDASKYVKANNIKY